MQISFHSRRASWDNRAKPKGPVFETTSKPAVRTFTDKRGFVTSKFRTLCTLAHRSMVTDGMSTSVRTATRLVSWFQHPVHPMRLKPQLVGYLIQPGIQTMTAITTASSAITTPTQGTADPIQLHADAHNALNMAVFYLRQPTANVAGARRKAIQALSALRSLSISLEG